MSTKNLSRTVIEGGRVRSNKWERRHSSRAERAKTREYLANIAKDPEFAEDETEPKRIKVYKEFDDKLGPVYRWLHSQVGKNWNEIKSEVFTTFDTRNLAGSHIVYEHLLSSVEEVPNVQRYKYRTPPEDPTTSFYKNDFYVDENGLLQIKKYISRKSRRQAIHTKVVTDWLAGRIVGKVGNKMYWFIPVSIGGFSDEWKCVWTNGYFEVADVARRGGIEYYKLEYVPVLNKLGEVIDHKPEWKIPFFWKVKRISARQDQEFSKKDLELWNEIPYWCQNVILQWAPDSLNPPRADNYSYYW